MVLDGALAPGQRLSETALAGRLGLSRTPLREAMAQLAEEGFLERVETGGYRVRALSVGDIRDGIDLRGTVEGLALRRAAERGVEPALLDRAKALIAEGDAATEGDDRGIDRAVTARINEDFHALFGPMSGSGTIVRELDRVRRFPFAGPSAFFESRIDRRIMARSIRMAQSQHRAMIDAVECREGARAEALAREHALLPRSDLNVLRRKDVVGLDRVPGFAMMVAGTGDMPARENVSNGRTS